MAFPTSPNFTAKFKGGHNWKTIVTDFGNGNEQRGKRFSSKWRTWELSYENVTYTEMNLIKAHFDSMYGKYTTFSFTDPRDSTAYTVRYNQDDFPEPTENGIHYSFTILLKEVS